MNILSLPPIFMAGIFSYLGLNYLVLYFRRKQEYINLVYSLLCFSILLYDISCASLYSASNFADGLLSQKGNFVGVSFVSFFFIWFIILYTKSKPGKIIRWLTYYFLFMIPVILFFDSELTLSINKPMPKHIKLGNLIDTTLYEVDPGVLLIVELLVMLAFFIYVLGLLIKYYRAEDHHEFGVVPLGIAVLTFITAAVNDSLVALAVYPLIYLSEYAFMLIVLSIAYALLNRFVNLHEHIEDLNINLERNVAERTAELQETMAQLVSARDALWGDLQLAKKIQTILLPEEPKILNYDISAMMTPADEVGGDYYDVINVHGKNWIVIGDVSGHGVPAGLMMMMVQTAIHSVLEKLPDLAPHHLLNVINRVIYKNIQKMSEDKYMTITVFACYENGLFTFAGLHQDIFLYRAQTKKVESIETTGMWIGIVDDVSEMVKDKQLTMNIGDTILLYTDGITEALDKNGHMFTNQKLCQVFKNLAEKTANEIKQGIMNALDGYHCPDDVTIVIFKRVR